MKGKISVEFYNKQIRYEFSLDRKYSILTGDSGTGKTSLRDMVHNYYTDEDFRSVTILECIKFKRIVTREIIGENLKEFLKEEKNCLVLLDGGDIKYYKLSNYAKYINASDNYFLFITRDPLGYLPYSYRAIYEIITDYSGTTPINRFESIYKDVSLSNLKPDVIMTEDMKSGHQFYSKTASCPVISARGKTRIKLALMKEVVKSNYSSIYVIADGAAIGFDIGFIIEYLQSDEFQSSDVEVNIFLPESFEYLILKTGVFNIPNLEDILERTYDYCDVSRYASWERLYTKLLESKGYKKSELGSGLLTKEIVPKVYAQLSDLDESVMDLNRLNK